MNQKSTQTQPYRAMHMLIALYLGLFVSWFAPHHAQAHCAGDLATAASIEVAGQVSAHHPELCQLCHAHGQVDMVPVNPAVIDSAQPVLPATPSGLVAPSASFVSSLSPRAPPTAA